MEGLTPPRPLAREDDRSAFDCGREALNAWFRRHAWANQDSGVTRTSVVCDGTGLIAGYVSLSVGEIARASLPKPAQRNRPDPLPVVLLGQLAVDRRFQKRGLARTLTQFALRTALRVSDEIGCWGVLTHPIDDMVRTFYGAFGFVDLPFDPRGSMIVRIADLRASGF